MTTTLASFTDTLRTARDDGRGVGAFNVICLEHAEGIVTGAQEARKPVVLQISQNCVEYHGALAPIVRATQLAARESDQDVLVHLDHVEDPELVLAGIDLGVDSIMFDGSRLPYEQNVAETARLAALCHAAGIGVEAELGEVGGKDGVHAPGARTDPDEAVAFVEATGVDALAVAVGTSHAMRERVAAVDRDLIRHLRASVPVPLVLHGSSGLSDDELRAAVGCGMTKVNISTHLNAIFTDAVRDVVVGDQHPADPRRYLGPARSALAGEVARLLLLLAGPR
ncbi:class II fructose-bisphosphate aldolase [Luteimicrobium xylanilyticum]|uniref:Fructose-bisphosphate aldolase n=1 Tax=Luteimicrobium xylanilyticum TaxID=1133546 RepID=A0A5P9QBG4_9MICO|nr:class II fructose-bisphosphate aldolase [Luteimicrobium xylanilyticum]QFU98788.1 Fructose-bisphosphate aldolase [Luteimicrobium xylanilyticum]